jgi:hypothetical protein
LRGGVDYLDYEESTHEKKGNKTAAKRFIIDNDRQGFAEMQYMPGTLAYDVSCHVCRACRACRVCCVVRVVSCAVSNTRRATEARNGVIRLIYLTTINALDCGKLPYTRSQQGACRHAIARARAIAHAPHTHTH